MCSIDLNKTEKLIFSLLFNDKIEYEIDLSIYTDLNKRTEFRENIRNIIKLGEKEIYEDRIIHREDNVIWKIEIKNKK